MYPLTAPTAEPVTVSQAKAALRIDDTRFDSLLPGLITSARAVAEQETGRQLVEQTWRIELPDWPASTDVIPIYRATAAAVSYWNGSTWPTLATNLYAYAPDDITGNGTSLAPALNTSWPTLVDIAIGPRVRIDLTAGVVAAQASTVPAGIQTFIVALVGQLIQSPELSAQAAVQAHPLLARLLDPWRLY
ncbi:MAG: hypothetical protein RJA36_1603 [Pseudomonadota bacterium]|jgi:uncharacterized phiE125 gp8 family phage protein